MISSDPMETVNPKTDLLIVASHTPEMAGLRTHLGDSLIGEVRGLAIRGKAVGLGLAVAGSGTARGIVAVKPRAVMLIGTCAVYPGVESYRPLDVIVARDIQLFSPSVYGQTAAFPAPMPVKTSGDPHLSSALENTGPRVFCANVTSPLATTTSDHIASQVHAWTKAEVENLEAFAVASACKAAEIPFATALGVTNIVGSNGHEDWHQFQRSAVNAAAEVITAWVQNGAQGLPHG